MTKPTLRLRRDLHAWLLFQRGTEREYLVGSRTVDRYIVVDDERYPLVMRIIQEIQQGRSPDEVQARFAREGIAVDVSGFLQFLARVGLTEPSENPAELRLQERLRILSWEIISLPLEAHWPRFSTLWKALAGGLAIWLALSTLLIGWLISQTRWIPLPAIVQTIRWTRYHQPWLWLAIYVSIWLVVLPLHEAGHAILASAGGIYPRRLFVRLYMGVWPVISIQLPGLYTLPLRWRVAAIIAGPLMNLALANTFWLLGALLAATPTIRTFWFTLAILNYLLFILNCLPIAPLDGYYALSQGLFKELDIRQQAWKAWHAWRQGTGPRPRFAYLLFLGVDLGFLGAFLGFVGIHIHRLIENWLSHSRLTQFIYAPLSWLLIGIADVIVLTIMAWRLISFLGIRKN